MSKRERNNLYIPSIDAKDIYISNNYIYESGDITANGYSLKKKNGEANINKFKNSFDYSLDLLDLRTIAETDLPKKDPLSFIYQNKEYSNKIINITFKYAVKEYNRISKDVYVKFGYHITIATDLIDGKVIKKDKDGNDVLVAIQVGYHMREKISPSLVPSYFRCEYNEITKQYSYIEAKNIPTLYSARDLREKLYTDGFICDGCKYIRYKRSSGSARVGKVLFIDQRLYNKAHLSESCGLNYKEGDKLDLAGFEAYIALPTSSIIDTIPILPENILVIDDYDSVFQEEAIRTYEDENHHLRTEEKLMTISNSIWDGQSLIESELMGQYSNKGMILLRNKFFKSCCFNTNIQQFFKDNGITNLDQIKGETIAKSISDIKLITTRKSIKYYKFGKFNDWLANIYKEFGVVKYEKDTHFFDGRMVQAHYQLLNTLQLNEKDIEDIVRPGLEYISLLNTDVDVMRYHIGCKVNNIKNNNIMKTKNEIVYKLLQYNCGFENTKIYYDFKHDMCKSYVKNIKKGHVLIDGTYATLFGNPYEMLLQSINQFDGTTSIPVGTVYNTRYPFGTDILCCRSPHVTIGNLMVTKVMDNENIRKYFNLTDKIICINSINENTLERLSGADFDSDQCIITNNTVMVEAAKRYYDLFKVPTRDVNPPGIQHTYTAKAKSDLDYKTGTNKIGEIVNFSQELNSLLWDKVNKSGGDARAIYDEIKDIYYDVCQLDVMSNIEIDKAKKEFDVNNGIELKSMKDKYVSEVYGQDGKKIMPKFLGYIARIKKYNNLNTKNYKNYKTSMDYLLSAVNSKRAKSSKGSDFIPLREVFKFDKFDNDCVYKALVNNIIEVARKTNQYISMLHTKKDMDYEDKQLLILRAKEDLAAQLNDVKINEHTMYRLLTKLDKPENSDISNLLFYILFNYENNAITNILSEMKQNFVFLSKDNSGEIDIYGEKYKKISQKQE